jgi:glutathione peroxidase
MRTQLSTLALYGIPSLTLFFTLSLNMIDYKSSVAETLASGAHTRINNMVINPTVLNHTVKTIDGTEVNFEDYRGKSLLIVNTASYCGYTKQYADLKKLQDLFSTRGFTVLAFPCNDFGNQEPGSAKEIKRFCKAKFDINFPLFEKVHARGESKSPLYKTLTEETAEGIKGEVKWNFTKFLVNPRGEVVARFESGVNPNSPEVHKAIEETLKP